MDYKQRFFRTPHWFLHEHRRHHWGWSHSKNQKDEERRTGKVPEWNEWMVRHRSSVLRFTFEFECEDMWKDKNYGKEDWNISRTINKQRKRYKWLLKRKWENSQKDYMDLVVLDILWNLPQSFIVEVFIIHLAVKILIKLM